MYIYMYMQGATDEPASARAVIIRGREGVRGSREMRIERDGEGRGWIYMRIYMYCMMREECVGYIVKYDNSCL